MNTLASFSKYPRNFLMLASTSGRGIPIEMITAVFPLYLSFECSVGCLNVLQGYVGCKTCASCKSSLQLLRAVPYILF